MTGTSAASRMSGCRDFVIIGPFGRGMCMFTPRLFLLLRAFFSSFLLSSLFFHAPLALLLSPFLAILILSLHAEPIFLLFLFAVSLFAPFFLFSFSSLFILFLSFPTIFFCSFSPLFLFAPPFILFALFPSHIFLISLSPAFVVASLVVAIIFPAAPIASPAAICLSSPARVRAILTLMPPLTLFLFPRRPLAAYPSIGITIRFARCLLPCMLLIGITPGDFRLHHRVGDGRLVILVLTKGYFNHSPKEAVFAARDRSIMLHDAGKMPLNGSKWRPSDALRSQTKT